MSDTLFGGMNTEGLEKQQDRLGGFTPLSSDTYDVVIKTAYAGQSAKGARSVTILGTVPSENDREYRETIWVSTQGGDPFYTKDGKKYPLPGFTTIDNICLVTTEMPLEKQPSEEKMVKIWDKDKKEEVATSVPVLTELTGKTVTLGIQKVMENVNEQQGDKWVPTPKIRESNQIDTVFHTETKKTVVEAREGREKAEFYDKWREKNQGQVRDNRELKDGQGGNAGRPPKAGEQSSSAPSLFGS